MIQIEVSQDWRVLSCTPSTRGGLHVRGENLCFLPGDVGREFSWEINQWSINSGRFDWSNCQYGEGSEQRIALLKRLAEKL